MNGVPIFTVEKRGNIKKKRGKPHTPVIFSVRCRSTMAIGIGHYRQNITPTEAIKGGIKSPDIIDERGTGFYGTKAREY